METAYELVLIVDTNLSDEQYSTVLNKYTGILTANGATIDDIDRWDPRRLAYEIKGRREGVYVIVNFRSTPAAKDEMDRVLRISDDTVRHQVVKQDKKADRYPSRARVAEYERREREAAARAAANPPPAPVEAAPVTELSAPQASAGVTEDDAPENLPDAAI
jgi:small subunit ribosomal protein S6